MENTNIPIVIDTEIGKFDFGMALKVLKGGIKVAREGWNGKGMWLQIVNPKRSKNQEGLTYDVTGHDIEELPWIGMKTADNKFVPWLASQTDILAEDWMGIR